MGRSEETIVELLERVEKSRQNYVETKIGRRDVARLLKPTRRKVAWGMIFLGATLFGYGGKTFLDKWNEVTEANLENRRNLYDGIVYEKVEGERNVLDAAKILERGAYFAAGGIFVSSLGALLLANRQKSKYKSRRK